MDWIVSTIVSTGLWQRSPSSSSDSLLNVHPATPHFGPSLSHKDVTPSEATDRGQQSEAQKQVKYAKTVKEQRLG